MGVWKSHPWCEAIIAGSLSSRPPPLPPSNPSPLNVASPLPSIIPTSLVRKLGWHLAALSPLPALFLAFLPPSPRSISHPLLPVHWLVYGGWHWANSISRPRQPLSLPEWRSPPIYGHTPPAGCHSVFYTSHLPCPPVLHRTFYFLICHSCFPFTCLFFSLPLTFKSPVSLGRCFEMALLCWDSEMLYCAAAPVEIVDVSRRAVWLYYILWFDRVGWSLTLQGTWITSWPEFTNSSPGFKLWVEPISVLWGTCWLQDILFRCRNQRRKPLLFWKQQWRLLKRLVLL